MRNVYLTLIIIFYLPYYILLTFYRTDILKKEVKLFEEMYESEVKLIPTSIRLIYLLEKYPEFISLVNFRLGMIGSILNRFYRGQKNLYIVTNKIGANFRIWHGFSTIVNAKSIGANCSIWQQVTIGNKDDSNNELKPIIKDNVKICAGAIVFGDIVIEDNVVIGAGAVVSKSVPKNCVVVGNPAFIIRKDGISTYQKL